MASMKIVLSVHIFLTNSSKLQKGQLLVSSVLARLDSLILSDKLLILCFYALGKVRGNRRKILEEPGDFLS